MSTEIQELFERYAEVRVFARGARTGPVGRRPRLGRARTWLVELRKTLAPISVAGYVRTVLGT